MNTAVLFIIFNREDTATKVFSKIREQKPSKLYVAADGPRAHKEGEDAKCKLTRETILNMIDWECDVKTLFRDANLGCRKAVSSAIDWFFQNEEMGIILEDDCLPDSSFFNFCTDLLEKYKDDERVMMISGDNFQNGKKYGKASYYFSKYVHIWGWASWRRAWAMYDIDMKDYAVFKKENRMDDVFKDEQESSYWLERFDSVALRNLDTWDYQWVYTVMKNNALAIMPNVNLISNIGFGTAATHTTDLNDPNANIPTQSIKKIEHPAFVLPNADADKASKQYLGITARPRPLRKRILSKIKRTIYGI